MKLELNSKQTAFLAECIRMELLESNVSLLESYEIKKLMNANDVKLIEVYMEGVGSTVGKLGKKALQKLTKTSAGQKVLKKMQDKGLMSYRQSYEGYYLVGKMAENVIKRTKQVATGTALTAGAVGSGVAARKTQDATTKKSRVKTKAAVDSFNKKVDAQKQKNKAAVDSFNKKVDAQKQKNKAAEAGVNSMKSDIDSAVKNQKKPTAVLSKVNKALSAFHQTVALRAEKQQWTGKIDKKEKIEISKSSKMIASIISVAIAVGLASGLAAIIKLLSPVINRAISFMAGLYNKAVSAIKSFITSFRNFVKSVLSKIDVGNNMKMSLAARLKG